MDRKELIRIRINLIKRDFSPDCSPVLIAVSKKQPVSDIQFAYDAGIRDFGENRVEELLEKAKELQSLNDIRWHFIGNIQSKKIKKLLRVENLFAIHSIDSFDTLQKVMAKEEDLLKKNIRLFLQANTSREKEKGGFEDWDKLAAAVNLLAKKTESFSLAGLMTMSKLRTNNFEEDAKKCFIQLTKIKKRVETDFDLKNLKLSMGMSRDYLTALEIGTDYIRLGSSLFAEEKRGR